AGRRGRHPFGRGRGQEDGRRRLAGAVLHRAGLSRPGADRRMRRGDPAAQGSPQPRQPAQPASQAMTDGYRLARDADLTTRNTFGVPARARLLVELDDADALPRLFADGSVDPADPALLVLGGGSNLLFAGDAPGPVLALTAQNVETGDGDENTVLVRASAGVPWHGFVMHTLSLGLCGLENLALIPGTVGAAPIQNIGAYGVEVCERVHAVEVFERATGRVRRRAPGECGFAYRDSAFKRDPRRWIVTAVEFALSRRHAPVLDYAGLRDELATMA